MDEIKSPGVDFVLVMSLIFLGLAQSSDAQIGKFYLCFLYF